MMDYEIYLTTLSLMLDYEIISIEEIEHTELIMMLQRGLTSIRRSDEDNQ